jgi:biopolymer transport protein ExbD
MNTARVNVPKMRSPLEESMRLRPHSRRGKKSIVAGLMLTSLVDAFSIMLLYLLCQNPGNGSTLELQKMERLPVAIKTSALNEGTMIRVEGNQYFLGQEPIEEGALAARLQQKRATEGGDPALIIQADRDADFAKLTSILRAASVSGYHQFKFAVLQGEGQ